MKIDTQTIGAVTVVRPRGPLLAEDAAGFAARLSDSAGRARGRVVLDAGDIPYADSEGLERLADAGEAASATGQLLRIAAATPTLRTVLEITELSPLFDHYQDVKTAVRSFL